MSIRFVTIGNDGRITRVYRGKQLLESDLPIPHDAPVSVGMFHAEFDSSWVLRPLEDRIGDGLVQLPARSKIEGGKIVPKCLSELVAEGLETPPPGQKLVGELFVPMSMAEKLNAGQLSPEVVGQVRESIIQAKRYEAYVAELDPIRADIERARINGQGGEQVRLEALYRAKDAEIRTRYPKP